MNRSRGLTTKQRRFVEEYLVDANATQAAIRAGYSNRTAAEIGYENLRKPHIAAELARCFEGKRLETKVDAEWVLQRAVELYGIAIEQPLPKIAGAVRALELITKLQGLFETVPNDSGSRIGLWVLGPPPTEDEIQHAREITILPAS